MRCALLLALAWAWLLVFVAAPAAILAAIALAEADPGLPPFRLAFSEAPGDATGEAPPGGEQA